MAKLQHQQSVVGAQAVRHKIKKYHKIQQISTPLIDEKSNHYTEWSREANFFSVGLWENNLKKYTKNNRNDPSVRVSWGCDDGKSSMCHKSDWQNNFGRLLFQVEHKSSNNRQLTQSTHLTLTAINEDLHMVLIGNYLLCVTVR